MSNVSCRRIPSARLLVTVLLALLVAFPLSAQNAGLHRLVVVGDSLSAGYQNNSLLWYQQLHGYAKVVANQARVPLELPLIAYPGVPNVLQLITVSPLDIQTAPGQSFGRLNPFIQPTDLAVPGAKTADVLNTRPGPNADIMTNLVLGYPGLFRFTSLTQVEWAERLHPSTVILWIGNNDVLGSALAGTALGVTPVADFKANYGKIVDRLARTGARLVLANIPDVTVVAQLVPAEAILAQAGPNAAQVGALLGIAPGDYVRLTALSLIQEILAGKALPSALAPYILHAADVATIRQAIDDYNAFIASEAELYHGALADVHATLNQIHAAGYTVDGRLLTTQFLGGIFSLDGVHPTNTGYAILANLVIDSINSTFHNRIRRVDVGEVAEHDPLVIPPVLASQQVAGAAR